MIQKVAELESARRPAQCRRSSPDLGTILVGIANVIQAQLILMGHELQPHQSKGRFTQKKNFGLELMGIHEYKI